MSIVMCEIAASQLVEGRKYLFEDGKDILVAISPDICLKSESISETK